MIEIRIDKNMSKSWNLWYFDIFDEKDDKYKETIILSANNWNDFGYRTTFNVAYWDSDHNVHNLGMVKIYCEELDKINKDEFLFDTVNYLPSTPITQLDQSFCSLGVDLGYYQALHTYLPNDFFNVLHRLNDMAYDKEIQDKFIDKKGVIISLLRFSSAEKASYEARDIFATKKSGTSTSNNMSFIYNVKLPYDKTETSLFFDFGKTDLFPYRINIIVGKNGAGKTRLLASLANSLSGYTNVMSDQHRDFEPYRPPIDRVMSISYSAFDAFKKPPKTSDNSRSVFSYVYCGIQSPEGTLNLSALKVNLKESYSKIILKNRVKTWENILSNMFEADSQTMIHQISNNRFEQINLSSGQHILICTITELVANIENESIILFDEPEIHLHPNAISSVVKTFNELLEEFNSYAIFATHSPLILQEIPSRYIQILERNNDMLIVRKPEIECFGNNISEIVFEVFEVAENESNYKTHLRKLSKKHSFDDVVKMFDHRLSFNALMFLKSCYGE